MELYPNDDPANDPYWGPILKEIKEKEEKMLSSPWEVGFKDRGLGHGDFGIIVKRTGELVVECPNHAVAGHIVEVHNNAISSAPQRRRNKPRTGKKSPKKLLDAWKEIDQIPDWSEEVTAEDIADLTVCIANWKLNFNDACIRLGRVADRIESNLGVNEEYDGKIVDICLSILDD